MSIRINKILRTLNIGINTIQQYLINRGINIPNLGPGTKLDNDTCCEFLCDFYRDGKLKENASELFEIIKNKNENLKKITTNKKKQQTAKKNIINNNIAKIQNDNVLNKNISAQNVINIKLNQLIYTTNHIYLQINKTKYKLAKRILYQINKKIITENPIFKISTILNLDNSNMTFNFKDDTIYQKLLKISYELEAKHSEEIKERQKKLTNKRGVIKMRIRLSTLMYDNLSASLHTHRMSFTYKFSHYIPKETIKYINKIKDTSKVFHLEKDVVMYIINRRLFFPDWFNLERYIVTECDKIKKQEHLTLSGLNRKQHPVLSPYQFGGRQYRTEFKIENIEFHDGYYYVSILKDGKKDTSIKSLYVKDRNSYESLSYLTKYFQKRMPNNLAIVYTKYNVLRLDHPLMLNNYIKILYENMNVRGEWWGDVHNSNKKTLAHCITHSTPYKIKKELDLKNAYIDYLSGHQSDKKVIKIYEVIGEHEEDCFIFTQEVDKDHLAIIFENINPSRSSEIFLCENDFYDDCIYYIFDYFTNYGVDTKRMNIRTKAYTAQQFKAVKYKSVNHESLLTWSETIQEFIGEINISHKIDFIPGLHISENPDRRKLTKTELDINHLHNTIMEKLYNILIKQYNKENVGTEIHIGEKRIDLVVKDKNIYDLYEIKTSPDVRTCIRQAFGQIIDYAFFESQDEIGKMYIVGTSMADQNENDYLDRLRKEHKLNIYYLCPNEM